MNLRTLVHRLPLLLPAVFLSLIPSACNNPDPAEEDSLRRAAVYLRDRIMKMYYYWNDRVPSDLDIGNRDIYGYFDALLVPEDRWSWMTDRDYYIDMTTGVTESSLGMSLSQPIEYYGDYGVYVSCVFKDGPAWKAGVRRGWRITHIGGVPIADLIVEDAVNDELSRPVQSFTFIDGEGSAVDLELVASRVDQGSALLTRVFTEEDFPGLGEPVGYFNYYTFIAARLDVIENAMAVFKDAGVRRLILDLRYNGGGDVVAANLLAGCLAPASADGEVLTRRTHNALLKKNGWDAEATLSRNELSLDLDLLMVITGHGTASASEMVLNGLQPLMNIVHVGDTTYGKPNGMYVMLYPNDDSDRKKYDAGDYSTLEYCFLPICFFNSNGHGRMIPDKGMIPDHYRPDDLYHDFGVEEDNIRACLTYIATGKFPPLPKVARPVRSSQGDVKMPLKLAEDDRNPSYGRLFVRK